MDRLFGLDSVSRHDDGLELLMTVYEPTLLAVVESILRDAEIPYLVKERGAGGSVKIIAGYSTFGTDVFVRGEQLELAKQLFAIPSEEESDDDQRDTSV